MLLEFEKPIVELEEKLSGMKDLAKDSDASVAEAILTLEKKIKKLKKDTPNSQAISYLKKKHKHYFSSKNIDEQQIESNNKKM